jgi:hypothetical protein
MAQLAETALNTNTINPKLKYSYQPCRTRFKIPFLNQYNVTPKLKYSPQYQNIYSNYSQMTNVNEQAT